MKGFLQQRRTSVLIINNNQEEIKELTKILSSHFEILCANDCKHGIDTLRANINKTSVVLLSSQLPSNNRFECLQKIKQDKILSSIPVIVCVDRNTQDYEEEWLDCGAYDYISKPYIQRLVVERVSNVSKLQETQSVLKSLEYDELTGLLTRQAFIHHAKIHVDCAPEKQYCILGVDVENFKLTNTQYGEERCNEFLAYIAGRFIETLETGFAGRFGGDQFVAMFERRPDIDIDYIRNKVNDILSSAPIPQQTVKIGVYVPIDTALPIVRCCDRAFLAIREVKGTYGKDIVFYEDRIQQQLLNEQRIIESMEKAIEEEQFKVFYQPKHETVTGKIAGAEALIRWEHPEYGFMSPGQFIPIFEKNGFITKIDSFVMQRVCKDLVAWQNAGIPVVPISINISRRDFFEPNWIDNHLHLIDEMHLDHSLLHMEVTESMYSENMEYIIEQVKKVQDLGYMIEMDDFGSGYSSLGLLSTFPLNVIKLDISFVRNIEVNEVVIENIIKMAHSMGFITVAEGAETKTQFKTLKELGCDLIQGYVFSKPLPAAEFEKYLRHNACSLEPVKTNLAVTSSNEVNEAIMKAVNEVAEGIPGGFFSYHADGNHEIIAINNEVLKLYECNTAAEFRALTGNSFDGMVLPEDLPAVQTSINEQITSDNNLDYVEYRIKCKNGNIKYIRDYGRLVHSDKIGDIFYVFLNDCTEEHNKLIEEKKINEVIQGVSQTYAAIFLLDYDSGKLSPYSISTNVLENIADLLKETTDYNKLLEIYAAQFVHKDDKESLLKTASVENIKKELELSNFFNFTYRTYSTANSSSLVEMSFRKLSDENSSNRVVITFRFISKSRVKVESEKNNSLIEEMEQYKRLEEDYKLDLKRAINKAEAANKSKNIFIKNITSHLLIHLNNIVSQMQIAREHIDDKEVVLECLNMSQDEQEALSFTINNIIELSKTESGDIEIHEVPTDVSGAIDKLINVIHTNAEVKNIKIETFYNVEKPVFYQDVTHTAEYACAVLFNALKYTPAGGTVSFGLNQMPGDSPDECIIEFRCKDNGIGISEDFMPHLFEKFAREDNEINSTIPSAGIGLTIVKNLINTVNGSIDIISEQGKGTEVIIKTKHRYADRKDIPARSGYISKVISNS